MDSTYEKRMEAEYKRKWLDCKFKLTSKYFDDKDATGTAQIYDEIVTVSGQTSKVTTAKPLSKYLTTPRLTPDLAPYLDLED